MTLMALFLSLLTLMLIYCTDAHTLQYIYTKTTPGMTFPEFISVGLLDGKQFVYYDSNISEMILKTEWIQKINTSDPDYWERETEFIQGHEDRLKTIMTSINQSLNRAQGGHAVQLMYGCQLHDDKSTTSYMKFGYNGEDFFYVDMKTGTWTADKHQAEIFIKDWDPEGDQAKYWKDFLETDCIDQLEKFLTCGNETLERKVRPEVSLFQSHSSFPEVVCHATGFFPKELNITWQKDGEDVSEDVQLRETLPNQDGSFQKRSVLKVSAEELQKHNYTCVIQHSSLEEDLVLPVSEQRILRGGAPIGIIIGVVVGLIGLVAVAVAVPVAVGIVPWKKKTKNSDFELVPVLKPVTDPPANFI